MNPLLGLVWVKRPPGFRQRSHMLEQKPPRRQPSPSVSSLNTTASAPNVMPEKKTATRYAPWIALLTGGFITYIIRTLRFLWVRDYSRVFNAGSFCERLTITPRLVKNEADRKTWILIPLV